jgi:hypothetical protein
MLARWGFVEILTRECDREIATQLDGVGRAHNLDENDSQKCYIPTIGHVRLRKTTAQHGRPKASC